jgi:hypothetical protein
MRRTGIALLDNRETKQALMQKLLRAKLPLNLVDKLVGVEQDEFGKSRRPRIMKQLDAIFSEIQGCSSDEDEQTDQVKTDVHSSHPAA